MLEHVYPAVKAANPQAVVVFGGLAYDHFVSEDGTTGQFNPRFLNDVLEEGGGDYFDVMNFHFYPLFGPGWERLANGTDIIAKANYLRDQLAAYGLQKPFVCTEVGVPSISEPSICPACSPHVQARYVAKTAVRSMAARLGMVIWFTWKDLSADYGGDTSLHRHGLLEENLQPKPAVDAFFTATLMLERATFAWTVRDDDAVEIYRFTRADGRPMYALWAKSSLQVSPGVEPDPVPVTLPLASATVTDMYGNATRVSGSGGSVQILATADPVLVH